MQILSGNQAPARLTSGNTTRTDRHGRVNGDVKTLFMLMVERLRLSGNEYICSSLRGFESAVAAPTYPTGENIRKAFRQMYVEVLYFGTTRELAAVEAVAPFLNVSRPRTSIFVFWPIWFYKVFMGIATTNDVLWKPAPKAVWEMVDWMRYAKSAE